METRAANADRFQLPFWATTLAAMLVYLIVAILVTFPLIRNLPTYVLESHDTVQVAWLMAWNTNHILSGRQALFDLNIMYPIRNALAYVEPMRGLLIPFAPFYWLTGQAVTAFNLSVLFGYTMSGFSLFVLLRALLPKTAQAWWASLLAGLLFETSPWRLIRFHHLEQLSAYWIPLAMLCLIRFLQVRRWYWLVGFVALTVLQTLVSYYYVPQVAVLVAVVMAYMLLFKLTDLRTVAIGCGAVVAAMVVAHVPLATMYLQNRTAQVIGPVEQQFFSINTARDFISSAQSAWLAKLVFGPGGVRVSSMERYVDAGVLAYVLFGVGLLVAVFGGGRSYRRVVVACLVVIAAGLALSIGPMPSIRGIQVPSVFMLLRSVPGIGSLRAPARMWQLALLPIAVVAALGVWKLTRDVDRNISVPITLALCCLAVLPGVNLGRRVTVLPPPAPVFQWINEWLPSDAVILHLPMHVDPKTGFPQFAESYKLYGSLYHHRTLVNSYLAFIAPEQSQRQLKLLKFPDPEAMETLLETGVTYVLIDKVEVAPDWLGRLTEPATQRALGLETVYDDASHVVLAVTARGGTTALRLLAGT